MASVFVNFKNDDAIGKDPGDIRPVFFSSTARAAQENIVFGRWDLLIKN